ncbi:hypothetical protein CSV80_15850 [Sporosarcina sp. P12(2017)]|uniref:hypothetical protein n=2 Tax=unclassified Sporosarcina TaxID=2647733 RepID=UPI000C170BCA|nr:hypothetical protein [Sporosarcina sp. P10]PIC56138.1 hypothetical protein CSV81_15855 [Sporosarcina sp. P10]PIC59466.1 hypothetical protein CSV80_15850 [Sporosarcina sp. P12(2017)]
MKKKIASLLFSVGLAGSLLFTSTVITHAADTKIESGIYFVSTTSTGEYYSFPTWSNLTSTQRGLLIVKYGQSNIKPYLQPLNKITSLEKIAQSGKPFLEASTNYQLNDLPGQFKDFETGKIIDTGADVNENFEVVSID